MPVPTSYSFTRYLSAKKSVDDRALNRPVWDALARQVSPVSSSPLQVLEVGAGIGTMIERVLDWGLLSNADYTALDAGVENITTARERLRSWATARGWEARTHSNGGLRLEGSGRRLLVELQADDLFDFLLRPPRSYDLLIAHAFLDLFDLSTVLPPLLGLLRPGGLFYFTLNFDGATLLEPAIEPAFDDRVQGLYHRTMDERQTGGRPSGDSRAGRHLFTYLRSNGVKIEAAGASDWVVFPGPNGYPADEAYFLHFILHTIHTAVSGHPDLDPVQFADWINARHAQIERCELVYIAHQVDFVGMVPGA